MVCVNFLMNRGMLDSTGLEKSNRSTKHDDLEKIRDHFQILYSILTKFKHIN